MPSAALTVMLSTGHSAAPSVTPRAAPSVTPSVTPPTRNRLRHPQYPRPRHPFATSHAIRRLRCNPQSARLPAASTPHPAAHARFCEAPAKGRAQSCERRWDGRGAAPLTRRGKRAAAGPSMVWSDSLSPSALRSAKMLQSACRGSDPHRPAAPFVPPERSG
jgi:hypothetical protein